MRVLGLIFLLLPFWSRGACLPESEITYKNAPGIAVRVLEDTVQKFESVMVRELPADHDLVIRLDTLNPRVNAEITKEQSSVVIAVWGGMLSHPQMKSNVLLLLLCHELGHLLGGPPLKSRTGWSSTEGQSDYYSTGSCMRNFDVNEQEFIQAALGLSRIYSEVTRQSPPRMDQCDQSVVDRINYGYPGVQCRLDTLLAGWKRVPRPRCWFIE